MTNQIVSRGTFALALMTGIALVVSTMGSLPDPVATKFGAGGVPISTMTRTGYVAFVLGFMTILPFFVIGMVGYLPRLMPGAVNVPYRDYWLAPVRRGASIDFLTSHGYWIAAMLVCFLGGLHWLTVEANGATPVAMSSAGLKVVTFTFLGSVGAWIVGLFVRFRRPPGM